MMQQFIRLDATAVALPLANVDTDQIIPARYLKVTDKDGLAAGCFADWRYAQDGTPRTDFILNQAAAEGAEILVVGDNFGCGSSREHAVWALMGLGFRAVVSTSFADIFQNNALKNGLLPIQLPAVSWRTVMDYVQEVPQARLEVELESQTLTLPPDLSFKFEIDSFSKACLLRGMDQLEYLLSLEAAIATYEEKQSAAA